MFYFLISPYLTYNLILIAAAVLPALYLMVKVYKSDRLEKESPSFLWSLTKAGVFSALIALVLERILSDLLYSSVSANSTLFRILLYFVVVGVSEEGAKYFMLKRTSWHSVEFNCLYDGIVYAVFVSLGFALWENVSYVIHYGFANALVRAFTAIPGHASFGVFMGVFYSAAKLYEVQREESRSKFYECIALFVPVLIHGAYDYIATLSSQSGSLYFIIFIAILFFAALKVIREVSQKDRYMV